MLRKQKLLRAALVLCCVALAAAATAQRPAIVIGPTTAISTDAPGSPHAESFVALNPANPKNIIATSIGIENGTRHSAVYASTDGGRTWHRARSSSGDDTVFKGGDPIVYFDASGNAYFGTIQGTPIGFLLSRSTDGGLTWGPPVTIPGGTYDRQYLAFDQTGGKFNGRLYAAGAISVQEISGKRHFAIGLVHSADGGRTFSQPRFLDGGDTGDNVFAIADLLVTHDGKLVVSFSTFSRTQPSGAVRRGRFWTAVSEDGGLSFLPAQAGPEFGQGRGYRRAKTHGAPRATIDLSDGPYRHRLYLPWIDFAEDTYNVKVAYSNDLGKTWSPAVIVNDNAGPDDPANPAIAVNRDGVVAVTFNDRRDDPKNECYRLYVSASVDGGATFLPNVRVRDGATCPNAPGNWSPFARSYLDSPLDLTKQARRNTIYISGVPVRWPNGGDTQGLVAGSDGTFHSTWINGESGVMQLWHTSFRVAGAALPLRSTPDSRDVTTDLRLELTSPKIDFENRLVSVDVRIVNLLAVPVVGPLTVVMDQQEPGLSLKNLRVANADNGRSQRGASWSFNLGGRDVLEPDGASEMRTFRWQFDGGIPDEPSAPVRAYFKILAPAGRPSR